jgi:hypothetical protein
MTFFGQQNDAPSVLQFGAIVLAQFQILFLDVAGNTKFSPSHVHHIANDPQFDKTA